MPSVAHPQAPVCVLEIVAMKSRHKLRAKPSRTQGKALRNRGQMVTQLAAAGDSGDVIAAKLGLEKNHLRAEHALDLQAGREIKYAEKAAAEAAAVVLTPQEYHAINAMTLSFASHWFDPEYGNLIFEGLDGKGARTIDDAFAAWKAQGGRWICTGLSNNFDKRKYAEFAKVVSAYREKLNLPPPRRQRVPVFEDE